MNENPVYPSPENGERPYPEPRKVAFWDPGFGAYSPTGYPTPVLNINDTLPLVSFVFYNPANIR